MRWEIAQFDLDEVTKQIVFLHKVLGGVSKSMLKKSRLDFDKIGKCE